MANVQGPVARILEERTGIGLYSVTVSHWMGCDPRVLLKSFTIISDPLPLLSNPCPAKYTAVRSQDIPCTEECPVSATQHSLLPAPKAGMHSTSFMISMRPSMGQPTMYRPSLAVLGALQSQPLGEQVKSGLG